MKLKFVKRSQEDMFKRAEEFKKLRLKRRTVREFSAEAVDFKIIENCVIAAASAPSGANKQPWKFVVVSNRDIKKKIREEAEKRERKFYESAAPVEWLSALKPLGTGAEKPFLEEAPFLIVVFAEKYKMTGNKKEKNYYVNESVGIATGFLVAALHNAGLAVLTYTPNPMDFLSRILKRPQNEKPFILIATGYPAAGAEVPDISRKKTEEVLIRVV